MTKSDLKTGMVVETREGIRYLVLEEFKKLIGENNFMEYHTHDDDLTYKSVHCLDIMKVYKPNLNSFNSMLNEPGEPIWERQRYYNGRVVCIDNRLIPSDLTIGKIYNFVNGMCKNDLGGKILSSPTSSFEELKRRMGAETFIEVVE